MRTVVSNIEQRITSSRRQEQNDGGVITAHNVISYKTVSDIWHEPFGCDEIIKTPGRKEKRFMRIYGGGDWGMGPLFDGGFIRRFIGSRKDLEDASGMQGCRLNSYQRNYSFSQAFLI